MNAITRSRPGHWADHPTGANARFMDLMDGDRRVSLAEQQDYLAEPGGKPLPVWLAISSLAVFPLSVALVVWLVRLSLQN